MKIFIIFIMLIFMSMLSGCESTNGELSTINELNGLNVVEYVYDSTINDAMVDGIYLPDVKACYSYLTIIDGEYNIESLNIHDDGLPYPSYNYVNLIQQDAIIIPEGFIMVRGTIVQTSLLDGDRYFYTWDNELVLRYERGEYK